MKKTLKAVIAAVLVASLLFGSVSASAVSLVPQSSYSNGVVSDGKFVPDETGYYCSKDTVYKSGTSLSSVRVKNGEQEEYLYYLEKDATYSVYSSEAPEFVGAEIDRISVSDPSVLDNLILGVDIKEGAKSISFDISAGIVFANGKTVYTNKITLVCENGIAAGGNEVKYDIPNYTEGRILNAYPLDEVIRSVGIKNESFYTSAYKDYAGYVFLEDSSDAVIVINEMQEIVANEFGYFVYSSRKYPVYIDREYNEDTPVKTKIYISGKLGDFEIASYDCKIVEANDSQNLERALYHYANDIEDLIYDLAYKYASLPTFLFYLSYPIMYGEYFVRYISLFFEYYSLIIGFLL